MSVSGHLISTKVLTDLNGPNAEVKEGHILAHCDGTLGANTTHGGAKTTIELEHAQFVKANSPLGLAGRSRQISMRQDLARN